MPSLEIEKPRVHWTRVLEFGLTSQSGRADRNDVSFRANLERRTTTNELRFQGRYLYGESNNERTTDNTGANFRVRQDLSTRRFAQAETRYEHDTIRLLAHDATQSVGMGQKLIDREEFKFAVGGGVGSRYRDNLNDGTDWTYLVDAFQDMKFTVNSHLSITQDLSLRMAPLDEDVYMVKLNTAFTSKISHRLNMSMRYEFEYDHSLLPVARESQRIVTSMGYAF